VPLGGIEGKVGELLHVVWAAAGQLDDLVHDLVVERDVGLGERARDRRHGGRHVQRSKRDGFEEAHERLVSSADRAEETRRCRDYEGKGDVRGVQLQSDRPELKQGVAGRGDQIDVVDHDDQRLAVARTCSAPKRGAKLLLDFPCRLSEARLGHADIEPNLEVELRGPAAVRLGRDGARQPSEQILPRLGVRHRQHDTVAGGLQPTAPMHQQRRLADRPLTEQRGVLRVALAGPRDACLEHGGLRLTT